MKNYEIMKKFLEKFTVPELKIDIIDKLTNKEKPKIFSWFYFIRNLQKSLIFPGYKVAMVRLENIRQLLRMSQFFLADSVTKQWFNQLLVSCASLIYVNLSEFKPSLSKSTHTHCLSKQKCKYKFST